ncbi:hypothetical protein HDV64DRAFT_252824 [Trichoderma sp. TUCIM 5745]
MDIITPSFAWRPVTLASVVLMAPSTPCHLLNRRPKARRPESGDAGTTCIFATLDRIWIGWQDIRCTSWAILPSVE